MASLSDLEKVASWGVSWDHTFEGKALLNLDLSFRAVNHQFCQILGISPAEIMTFRFCDIMAPETRKLDIDNAKLIQEHSIPSYVLQRKYTTTEGVQISIITITAGVLDPHTEEVLFFVLHMMELTRDMPSNVASRKKISVWEWLDKKKIGMSLITIAAAICATLADRIINLINGVW